VASGVSPTERIRAEIDALFAADRDLASILEDVGRLSVRLVMQAALEAEVTEFLGRARYQRHEAAVESRPGARNGWQPPTAVKTTMGPVAVQRPKLRGTDERFCSRLFGLGVTRTNALESLVISGWVRGLSDRDIEATLAEVLGAEAALSRSTVSRICQQLKGEFTAWTSRSLAEVRLDYLYLDGSHFKMHPSAPAEPVLCAWGIDTDGKPVFVGLAPASSESTDAWDDFLAGLAARGLRPPLLVISDGAPGLLAAIETFRLVCGSAALSTAPATCSPRSPPPTRPRSRLTTGRSSTPATAWSPARWRSSSPSGRPRRSPPSGSAATRPPSPASPTTCPA
jgi:putative transposase